MKKLNLAVFASGNGSNAENIIVFCLAHNTLYNRPVLVTDNPEAAVIARAKKYNIETLVIEPVKKTTIGETKDAHEKQILLALSKHAVDLVCLAGYMRLLSSKFIDNFYDTKLKASRIVNIHPSMLPSFKGANAYRDAFDYGVKMSGVTLHFVDSGMDSGPIIMQESFPRFDDDTVEEFIARGLAVEYRMYREFLYNYATLEINPRSLKSGRQLITFNQEMEHVALV